jgi:hypothetical protein
MVLKGRREGGEAKLRVYMKGTGFSGTTTQSEFAKGDLPPLLNNASISHMCDLIGPTTSMPRLFKRDHLLKWKAQKYLPA